jgi:hypothetical protein
VISALEARIAMPLLFPPSGAPMNPADLLTDPCQIAHANELLEQWDGLLPKARPSAYPFAFRCHFDGVSYAVAIWDDPDRPNPRWLELRALAVSPDAPERTAARFVTGMTAIIHRLWPHHKKVIARREPDINNEFLTAAGWRASLSKNDAGRPRKPRWEMKLAP